MNALAIISSVQTTVTGCPLRTKLHATYLVCVLPTPNPHLRYSKASLSQLILFKGQLQLDHWALQPFHSDDCLNISAGYPNTSNHPMVCTPVHISIHNPEY